MERVRIRYLATGKSSIRTVPKNVFPKSYQKRLGIKVTKLKRKRNDSLSIFGMRF